MNNGLISYGSRTDCGLVRPHNEDSLVVYPPLFAVADGMGGHEAGEIASEIAIETLVAQAPKSLDAKTLGRAVMYANRAVLRAAKDGIGKPGMGTTMTAAMIDDDKLIIAQVGDSRAYLLHQGQLQRVTRDHSLMADYIETGQITEEESRWHPQRSVITRALGSDPDMVPDLFELNVEPGDRLLLCTDGLSGMVYDDGIRDILETIPDPQLAADALIEAANNFGGHDNITAIVVNVGSTTPEKERVRSHRSKRTIALFILAFMLILALAGGGLYAYAQNSAYLITENNHVTVYRGIQGNIAGVSLSWYAYTSDVDVSDLPASTAIRLKEGISVSSMKEADELVAKYQDTVDEKYAATSTGTQGTSTGSQTSSTGTRN